MKDCLWARKAKKDLTSCDKPRGGALKIPRSAISEWGQPGTGDRVNLRFWRRGPTRNWNISFTRRAKKNKVIPQVVASERGGAQTATGIMPPQGF